MTMSDEKRTGALPGFRLAPTGHAFGPHYEEGPFGLTRKGYPSRMHERVLRGRDREEAEKEAEADQ